MNEEEELTSYIESRDSTLGTLAREALESASDVRFMASLACLFIFAEQSVKLACHKTEGNFSNQITALRDSKTLSEEQADFLDTLRTARNKLFHENHTMWGLEDSEGKITFLSENEALEEMWDTLCLPTLRIGKHLFAGSTI
jgi:hypothetical protein